MTEEGKNKSNKQNKEKKRDFNENNGGSGSNKKPKLDCWKYGKTSHFKRDCRSGKKNNANAGGSGKGLMQTNCEWNWILSTTHVCKDCCWFKTYKLVEDGSVLYMGDDHLALVRGKGSVVLEFSSGKSITLFNVLYVPKLRKNLISGHVLNKCGYKQVYESDKYLLTKSGVFSRIRFSMKDREKQMFILGIKIKHCSLVSTPMDPVEKLKPNMGKPWDLAQNTQTIRPVYYYDKYYTLINGGAISWASKKQKCITGSTMESEFVALAAAGKEAEWLRNLIHEILI
ncbi:zinc finger, CCHC-type containing protein [Tanacetum coccineum]|uniref:Zinc finger, CCHC-type containing protein n=1 Tax=Tanacetum coccineum TaxID=301880 RepID=A0ABQ4ZBJ6_9ASTR